MSGNKSIRDFFRSAAHQQSHASTRPTPTRTSDTLPPTSIAASLTTKPEMGGGISKSTVESSLQVPEKCSEDALSTPSTPDNPPDDSSIIVHIPSQYQTTNLMTSFSSNLSPPPATPRDFDSSSAPVDETIPQSSAASIHFNGRVIKSSDDEEENSESDLEDMSALLAAKKPSSSGASRPQTPPRQNKTSRNFHTSPMPVHTKPKFDMLSLISHAREDETTEASSKRVKALTQLRNDERHEHESKDKDLKSVQLSRTDLLKSVVSEEEVGDMARVTRALMRTEATIIEKRFYFFTTQRKPPEPFTVPFPRGVALNGWEKELKNLQTREQSFVSGYVADMVELGKMLPDELLSWILDAAVSEPREPLRMSYFDVARRCPDQLSRLLDTGAVQYFFQNLGATEVASTLLSPIKSVHRLPDPYPNRDWGRLCSLIRFLGKVGGILRQKSREHAAGLILRMAADRVVFANVALFTEVQNALYHLIRDTPDREWDLSCSNICKDVFEMVRLPSFRRQIVDVIPSTTPRLHDFRRRLAMCFFFNNLSYSLQTPYQTIDLEEVIDRLTDRDFDAKPHSDYPEITALILLLDVAVDDGRSNKLDLNDQEVEKVFNKNVDVLVLTIKAIMTSIGNPGAAFISRIEAKETLEMVSQRILDTVRTKKPKKESWFDRTTKDEDNLASEKKGMNKFLLRTTKLKKEEPKI